MVLFLILMAIVGVIASQYMTWIFVTLVGLLILPLYVCAMLVSGLPFLTAAFYGFLGFTILQASYVLAGWALEVVRDRSAPGGPMGGAAFQPVRNLQDRLRTDWPLIGGWLPLVAFYDPPCRADGSPWNGVDDPGYRTTILAVGWFGRAFSVVVGAPKRAKVAPAPKPEPPPVPVERMMSEMDQRIARERAKSQATDETGPGR